MTKSDFTKILQHPEGFDTTKIGEIKSIIDQYPYFQSARAVYLKGLKNKGSYKYNQELKTTAAYTADRSVLFDFITSEEFLQNEISQYIKQNFQNLRDIEINSLEDISVNRSVIIDDTLRQHIKATEPLLDPALFEPKTEQTPDEIIAVDSPEIQATPEETLQIGKPLEFDKTELHSFSEWLKITNFKPIIREDFDDSKTTSSDDSKSKKFELIDKFIDSNPKMPQIKKEGNHENLAKAHRTKPDSLMTETLARIYLEQKNYDKAIQAYTILSLKYPEKSGFFADQIQAVKQIQEQNK